MPTLRVPKNEMLEILGSSAVIRDTIRGNGRWSISHELVFCWRDGKFYRTSYSVGATEMQDESPWDYTDPVECTEVREVQKTVTDYEPVP